MSDYFKESRKWETAVLLTVPLLALYEVGLWFFSDGSTRNAADVVLTRYLLRLDGRKTALIVNAAVLMLFLVAAFRQRRSASPGLLTLVVVESAAYAVLLPILGWVVDRLAALQAGGGMDALITDVALRVGAGLYEELLFRLGLISLLFLVFRRVLGVGKVWATACSIIVSAAVFSGFHHWGELGEAWDVWVFTFRFLAGVVLGLLFVFRGLGVACWTHALYNVHLLLVQ